MYNVSRVKGAYSADVNAVLAKIKNDVAKTYKSINSRVASLADNTFPFKKTRQLKRELELLTSYSSDTVYRLRYDNMSYDYISPAIVRLLGFSADEMKHLNFRSLIIETKIISDGIKSVDSYEDLEKIRKNGDVNKWHADYLLCTKDDRQIWVSDISYPWFDENGKVIGAVGTLRDITDRVRAESSVKKELLRFANTDSLTNLANRRSFFESLDSEVSRFKRTENHFSVLLVDVDHFKKVNDTHGHVAGDKILVQMADVMKKCLREGDVIARIGGEEFAILLPETPENSAFWVADRICSEIAKYNFFIEDSILPVKCTVSIGVSSSENFVYQSDSELTSKDLYKQADLRLYIAKNTGRNQVSVDEILQFN